MLSIDSSMNPGMASVLRQLPESDPDPALWSRIQSVHSQLLRRRRQRRQWIAGGLSVAALVCVVALSRSQFGLPHSGDVSVWQSHSRTLEGEWLAKSRLAPDPRLRAELRLIDLELQSAYDRGAAANELIPLWKLRNEALRELIENDGNGMRSVTRI